LQFHSQGITLQSNPHIQIRSIPFITSLRKSPTSHETAQSIIWYSCTSQSQSHLGKRSSLVLMPTCADDSSHAGTSKHKNPSFSPHKGDWGPQPQPKQVRSFVLPGSLEGCLRKISVWSKSSFLPAVISFSFVSSTPSIWSVSRCRCPTWQTVEITFPKSQNWNNLEFACFWGLGIFMPIHVQKMALCDLNSKPTQHVEITMTDSGMARGCRPASIQYHVQANRSTGEECRRAGD
jgi:hypothetical protein